MLLYQHPLPKKSMGYCLLFFVYEQPHKRYRIDTLDRKRKGIQVSFVKKSAAFDGPSIVQ